MNNFEKLQEQEQNKNEKSIVNHYLIIIYYIEIILT